MKFKTIKEMKEELAKVTNLKDLHQDMTFLSQGQSITVRYIGEGSALGVKSVAYVSDETASSARVEFTGSGRNINVTNVLVNKKV